MNAVAIDEANAKFWNELCGTTFARERGITGHSPEALRQFDQAYLDFYPYLLQRIPVHTMRGNKVLEAGLGYGTLGQKIVEAGADYTGLDIAQGPVDLFNHRMRFQGLPGRAIQGSILQCPLPSESVDCVVSVGCFHHTGNIAGCLEQTWRVLKPGGKAYVMVYNRFSYLRWLKWFGTSARQLLGLSTKALANASESERRAYDSNSKGEAAPETVFVSKRQLRHMMRRFSRVSLRLENSTALRIRHLTVVPRRVFLPNLGKLAGLDIYVDATK